MKGITFLVRFEPTKENLVQYCKELFRLGNDYGLAGEEFIGLEIIMPKNNDPLDKDCCVFLLKERKTQ